MKIQLDLPKELNKELKIVKIRYGFNSMAEAIITILKSELLEKNYTQKGGDENGTDPRS